MKMLFLSILAALALVQDGNIKWDKTLHDFGDVSVTDGPLTCTYTLTNTGQAYTLTNTGQEPIAIFEVVTSCGCTNVVWTKEPILPGKTGTVKATYKNEDGPMPFDKTLTVYISGVREKKDPERALRSPEARGFWHQKPPAQNREPETGPEDKRASHRGQPGQKTPTGNLDRRF